MSADGETQTLNPEVREGGSRPAIVREQLFQLTTITNRLRSAYNGHDVDWIDTGNLHCRLDWSCPDFCPGFNSQQWDNPLNSH